jgi:hypothetical protein
MDWTTEVRFPAVLRDLSTPQNSDWHCNGHRNAISANKMRLQVYIHPYCLVSGVCVTDMTGFGFDNRLYWTFILLVNNSSQITIWHTLVFVRLDTPRELFWLPLNCQFKSKSHCDWRSVSQSVSQSVSKSWCRAPDQIFITVWQLRSCLCGTPSLTRGRVCLVYMLLALC